MSKFKTMPGDLEIVRGGTLLEKANPYRDASTGRFTTGGGGGGAYITYGPANPLYFAAGLELQLIVGKGGDGGYMDLDTVGGAGADGKIILTWT